MLAFLQFRQARFILFVLLKNLQSWFAAGKSFGFKILMVILSWEISKKEI